MEVEVEVRDGPPTTGIIRLRGFVETPQARRLRRVLDEIETKGVGRIIFDLAEVPFISSTGLSLLVSYASSKQGEWAHPPVVLVSVQPAVEKAMQVLGLSGLFVAMADMESALKKFGLS